MSGDSYYFGDNVNMHGGRGNTGIVKNQAGAANTAAVSPALQSAVEELLQLVEELRDRVPPHERPGHRRILETSVPTTPRRRRTDTAP